jgi:uncharacterized Zn-finger protein
MHTEPPDMVVDGVVTKFVRDGDDQAIACPLPNCNNQHSRRSNLVRHLRNDHGLNPATLKSSGKRSLSGSLENLSAAAHKKAKIAVQKFTRLRSQYFRFCVVPHPYSPSLRSETHVHEATHGDVG